MKNVLGKTIWVSPATGKDKPIRGITLAQGPSWTWRVIWNDREVRCIPQGDVAFGENSQ